MTKLQKILLIGGSLSDLGGGMLGPLFAIFAQRVGGDILQISWASALYLFTVGVLTIIIGDASDKRDKRKIMLAGYGIGAVFSFAYLFASKPIHLFLIEAGLGLATALSLPTWNALYSEYGNEKNYGSSWGMASGLSRIVAAISIIVGGFIVSRVSFTALFLTMGILQTIATIYQAYSLYATTEPLPSKNDHLQH